MTDPSDMTDEELAQGIRDMLGSHKCCATCKHWDRPNNEEAWGVCRMNGVPIGASMLVIQPIVTTDLTLCSKWEQKGEGEA